MADRNGNRWVGASFSHKVNDANIMLASYDLIRNYSTTLPSTMYLTYVPQGILPNMVSVGNALNGGNLLGLSETPQACELRPLRPQKISNPEH